MAILLHDIGHGPFSHALEHSIVRGLHHEELSMKFMEALNTEMGGKLDLAISVFTNRYPRKFMNQLVSSFFNDTATTEIYTHTLHDALPN